MGLKYDEVRKVQKEFTREYLFSGQYSQYLTIVFVSKLEKILQSPAPKLNLKPNDNPNDIVILAGLKEPLPKDGSVKLPDTYKGVRVIYELSGEIKPQSK